MYKIQDAHQVVWPSTNAVLEAPFFKNKKIPQRKT